MLFSRKERKGRKEFKESMTTSRSSGSTEDFKVEDDADMTRR
jgi:hypothetical protein